MTLAFKVKLTLLLHKPRLIKRLLTLLPLKQLPMLLCLALPSLRLVRFWLALGPQHTPPFRLGQTVSFYLQTRLVEQVWSGALCLWRVFLALLTLQLEPSSSVMAPAPTARCLLAQAGRFLSPTPLALLALLGPPFRLLLFADTPAQPLHLTLPSGLVPAIVSPPERTTSLLVSTLELLSQLASETPTLAVERVEMLLEQLRV
jgi:hypothetical protein